MNRGLKWPPEPGFRIGVWNDGVVWVPDQAWNDERGWLAGRVVFGGRANGPGWASACDGREILRFAQE